MKKTKIITAIILLLFCATIFASENTELARINSILNSVYPLIAKAQKEAEPNSRIKFHYNWLQADIQRIQAGIAQKINYLPLEPSIIIPPKNSYITKENITVHPSSSSGLPRSSSSGLTGGSKNSVNNKTTRFPAFAGNDRIGRTNQ